MTNKLLQGLADLTPQTIFCIGRNYVEHAYELNSDVPEKPVVFLKPVSSIIYDGDSIHLPSQSTNVHHEVELVVAIGKKGKNIPKKEALSYIAGYAVGIDITARDIQQEAKKQSLPWAVAKGFDTFAPLSPFVPAENIHDPQNLDLNLSVNGQLRQQDNTKLMIFSVAELISYVSSIFTLQSGDLIFTGTPKGVSPIKSGDKIEATLDQSLAGITVTVA